MSNTTQHAIEEMLLSLGVGERLESGRLKLPKEMRGTPARVAKLWQKTLLKGEGADLGKIFYQSSPNDNFGADSNHPVYPADPVALRGIGFHLLCPHHLTVAFGNAQVAYIPGPRIAGLGALAALVEHCAARLILQEQATRLVVDSLSTHLNVQAAVVKLAATHPCHNLTHPRSHQADVVTQATIGSAKDIKQLKELLADG